MGATCESADPGQVSLDAFAQVLQQMKVVSNLSSLRLPLPDALGVKPAAVAADDFDLTDAEWALIEPLLPPASPLGRPPETKLRAVVNAILYMTSTGCQRRQMPKEFLLYSTVQSYFYAWSRCGVSANINHALVMVAREQVRPRGKPDGGRH